MQSGNNVNSIHRFTPRHKSDLSCITLLRQTEAHQAEPVLYDLLKRVQNRPVAQALLDVLPRFHRELLPHIQTALDSNTPVWKYWILLTLARFPDESIILLSKTIQHIAELPTEGEAKEEVDQCARILMKHLDQQAFKT